MFFAMSRLNLSGFRQTPANAKDAGKPHDYWVLCTPANKDAKRDSQAQTPTRVGHNLYRSDASGIYHASFKRNGKQIRRSLHTSDDERRGIYRLKENVAPLLTSPSAHTRPP
jgi:hypothetical protein